MGILYHFPLISTFTIFYVVYYYLQVWQGKLFKAVREIRSFTWQLNPL